MATLKVYDGTQWQTVAGQGAPGVGVPAGGTTGQRLVKATGTSFDVAWDGDNAFANWTVYTPRINASTSGEGGLTPGAGGFNWAAYRMIAPYTMAVRTRWGWGSSGGNGGAGTLSWSIPAGYTTDGITYQYLNDVTWTGDGFTYMGMVDVYPSDIWMRPRASWAGPQDRYISNQGPLRTDNTAFPINWYPNGGLSIWGVLNVGQRW